MAFGLGDKGFKRKRYSDIMENMKSRARALFGENVNLSERSPLFIILAIVAWSLAKVWELAEYVYNSAFVDTAEGYDFDKVAKYIGITRNLATKAKLTPNGDPAYVKLTGDAGAAFSEGDLVETDNEIEFELLESGSLDSNGEAYPDIQAVKAGVEGNVPAGTITNFVTPLTGITSVTNPEDVTGGRNEETTPEFKNRYDDSVAKGGASTPDAIRATLLDEVEGVRAAKVIQNSTMSDDSYGHPPKSVNSYVLGGGSVDIAEAILKTKAGGIQVYGSTVETVQDDGGNNHDIGFTYATEINIYIDVTLTTTAEFPSDGNDQVMLELIKYIGGEDADGNIYEGLSMGENVVHSRCIDKCYNVAGVEDVDISLSTDGSNYSKNNITIDMTEVAETDNTKVAVS